jgi:hypothetical protein
LEHLEDFVEEGKYKEATLEKKCVVENETEEHVLLVDSEEEGQCEEETLENEHVEKNGAKELV